MNIHRKREKKSQEEKTEKESEIEKWRKTPANKTERRYTHLSVQTATITARELKKKT